MGMMERARLVLGAVLVAVALFALMAGPGFMSDQDSTVPLWQVREVLR